jgi:hypothetical protein
MTSIFSRWFCSQPKTWIVQWATVNGRRVNIGDLAVKTALRIEGMEGLKPSQIKCTGQMNEFNDGLEVSSLKIWMDTDTHGRWALNKTTQVVRQILVDEYKADIPWFKR